jgi:hypothetical protein
MLIVIYGEKENYCQNLEKYLIEKYTNKSFIFIDSIENQNYEIEMQLKNDKIVITYFFEKQNSIIQCFNKYRIIEFYIGKREDIDCITILSYIDSNSIQTSLNIFVFKCLQEKRILLVSPGGSACTNFLKFLNKYNININTPNSNILGGDGLKHSKPDSNLVLAYNPTHIIYQYGDLDKTIRSLFRRKLIDISFFYDETQKYMNPSMRTNKKIKFNNFEDYINHVLLNKEEPLGIIKHWKSWENHKNVFFLNYIDIPNSPLLDEFLGLPLGTCKEFIITNRISSRLSIETNKYIQIINDIDSKERQINKN